MRRKKSLRRTRFKSRNTDGKKRVKELDDLWSKVIRLRDGPICPYCLKREVKNAHHIFSRRYKSARWELSNGIGLCGHCHKFVAHQDPEIFRAFVIKRLGREQYEALQVRAYKVKRFDIELSRLELTEYLNVMEEE